MRRLTNIAIVLLLGLFIVSAPFAGSAVAKEKRRPIIGNAPFFLFLVLFEPHDHTVKERRGITQRFNDATEYLRAGNKHPGSKRRFRYARDDLRSYAASAYADENRKLAQRYLKILPKKFLPGVAYIADDGTLVRDPDKFIRLQLFRDKYATDGGDGEAN